MSDTKKMVKTFGVFVGVLVIIFIVLFIFMAIAGSKVGNSQLVNVLENAAKKYYASHSSELPEVDSNTKISTSKLISEKYMKSFDKITKNTNCSGEVVVYNNNGEYLYVPSIKCNEYKTKTIGEVLEDSVVTTGDGIYKDNNLYYYRGEYVDNYIKIGDTTYAIMYMEDGKIKVIGTKLDNKTYAWDNRYNAERSESGTGINTYSKSRLKEIIDSFYEKVSPSVKKYVIKSDWCVAKKDMNNGSMANEKCTDTIKEYFGTITPMEYSRISLDENCNSLYSSSCKNYNYFSKRFTRNVWTMTAASNNTYTAFYISSGKVDHRNTSTNYYVIAAFNISDDLVYLSGEGTLNNPYIVR